MIGHERMRSPRFHAEIENIEHRRGALLPPVPAGLSYKRLGCQGKGRRAAGYGRWLFGATLTTLSVHVVRVALSLLRPSARRTCGV